MSSYSSLILSDHPLAYYRLDESSGITAFDSSGNGSNAVLPGDVNFGQAGAILNDSDTSTFFSNNDVFLFPSDLNLVNLSTFSLELWVNITSGWQHIVVTFNGTTVLTYLNGQLSLGGSGADLICVEGHGLYIVLSSSSYLDEIACYNYVLSPAQVAAHYANNGASLNHLINGITLLTYIDSLTKALIDYVTLSTSSNMTNGANAIITGINGTSGTNTIGRILAYADVSSENMLLEPVITLGKNVTNYLADLQSLNTFSLHFFPLFDILDSYISANSVMNGLNDYLTRNNFQVNAYFALAFNYYQTLAAHLSYRTYGNVPLALSTTNFFPYANVDPLFSFTCTGDTTLTSTPGFTTDTQGGGIISLFLYKTNAGTGAGGTLLTITYINGEGTQSILSNFAPGSLLGNTSSVTSSNALTIGIKAQAVVSVTGIGMTIGEMYAIGGQMTRTISSY